MLTFVPFLNRVKVKMSKQATIKKKEENDEKNTLSVQLRYFRGKGKKEKRKRNF
jgi:hypothetical protein